MNRQIINDKCENYLKSVSDSSVSLIIDDPPYGINYKHANGSAVTARSLKTIKWDSIDGDAEVDGEWLKEAYRVLKDGGALYICTRWDVEPLWRDAIVAAGFELKQRLTWYKRVHGMGDLKGTYATNCEDVLFACKGRHVLNKRLSMLLDAGCVPTWEVRYHPHQKPIELGKMLIENSSQPGDLVLEPHCGSASFGCAALITGRNYIGIEVNKEIAETAHNRLHEMHLDINKQGLFL